MNVEKLKVENESVLSFIKNWQSKNEYKPESLNEYNAKFKKEFDMFLNNSSFSRATIDFFN